MFYSLFVLVFKYPNSLIVSTAFSIYANLHSTFHIASGQYSSSKLNILDIENYNFWNLKTGEEKERLIRQDKIKEINNYIKIVTVNDLKISSF